MKVALIQFDAGQDKASNVRRAEQMTQEALGQGARFVLLPEIFSWRGDTQQASHLAQAAENVSGDTVRAFQNLARRAKAFILLGSFFEKSAHQKVYNTSLLIAPDASVAAKYRKIHLFDARIGDKIIRESDRILPGRRAVVAKIEEWTLGLSVCYDLRFPQLYRRYGQLGAHMLTVPSCFTQATGQAHWEVLLRARAIENFAYVLAPNQIGVDARGVRAYGHSMIVAPWGEVLACGSLAQEEIIYGDVDKKHVDQARKILPGIVR